MSELFEKSDKKGKSMLRDYGEALLTALVLALIIRTFFLQAYTIPSGSMLQTLQIGDYVLVNKFLYGIKIPFTDTYLFRGEDPQRGDIIVFRYPEDPDIDFIKRIVGVPGDVVEMRNKQFYRNGEAVKEDYIQQLYPDTVTRLDNMPPFTVPADSYFVMGDNRDNSLDSRAWGVVRRTAIHGKAWRLYWSWDGNTHTPRLGRLGRLVE
jgi:signal peptidase I